MINGTSVILQNSEGDIVGQMEMTLSFNGAVIDVTNKSFEDWVTVFDGKTGSKQLQISGSIVYNDDAQYRKIRHDAFNGILDNYTVTYVSGVSSEEIFSASMMPNALSDSIPHGDKLTTSISFLSSGVVSTSPQITIKALVTNLYPIIAIEDRIQGSVLVSDVKELVIRFETPLITGTVSIDQIQIDTFLPVEYSENELEITGTALISAIDIETFLVIEYDELEAEITGTVTIESVIITDVLVLASENESEITGSVSVSEINITTV